MYAYNFYFESIQIPYNPSYSNRSRLKIKTSIDELWIGTFNERSWHENQCLNCKSSVQEHVYYKFKSLYLPLVFRHCLFQNK